MDFTKLPLPDQHANYWFSLRGDYDAPALLVLRAPQRGSDRGKYCVSLGKDGMVWDRDEQTGRAHLKAFDDAKDALRELRRQMSRMERYRGN